MLKELGKSFLDVFKRPFFLFLVYVVFVVIAFVFSLASQYTIDYVPDSTANIITVIMYYIVNHVWVIFLYFALFLFASYVTSLIIANLINKKQGSNAKFSGVAKIFGFTIFLAMISFVPYLIFSFFGFGWIISLLVFILTLLLMFLIYPAVFFVPVLLPSSDLSSALSNSWSFAKKKLGRIALLEILAVLFIMLLSGILDFISIYINEIIVYLVYLLIFTILFIWGIYFTYNWYYQNN